MCETNDDGNLDISVNRIQNEIRHIEVAIKDLNSNSAKLSSAHDNSTIVNDPGDFLDNEIYNLTTLEDENSGAPSRAILKELQINLGSSDLPRFSCANHKHS